MTLQPEGAKMVTDAAIEIAKRIHEQNIQILLKSRAWGKLDERLKAIAAKLPPLEGVNHYEAIKAIYLHDRWPGVDTYCLTYLQRLGILDGVNVEGELKKKNKII